MTYCLTLRANSRAPGTEIRPVASRENRTEAMFND